MMLSPLFLFWCDVKTGEDTELRLAPKGKSNNKINKLVFIRMSELSRIAAPCGNEIIALTDIQYVYRQRY